MSLDSLVFMKRLGVGQFGAVYLVQNKNNGKFYALKCISRAQTMRDQMIKHVLVIMATTSS
jgi:cGMP-dependent protein kinase